MTARSTLELIHSVVRAEPHKGTLVPIRRARGYAPSPIHLGWNLSPTLAAGAELKNTFCLTREKYAFLSQHIGNLSNYETLAVYEKAIAHHEHLFRIKPELIAHDMHPDYLSTRYALERAERDHLPALAVQHHHAHIAACMAEHSLPDQARVIGFAFDGTGYGPDGAIWGGEVLLASYRDYRRLSHLDYLPMPGGDRAVKQPWRLAMAWLNHLKLEPDGFFLDVDSAVSDPFSAIQQQIADGINAPLTSSIGRLFDAVAALTGLRSKVSYEGQAAIELENRVDPDEEAAYLFEIGESVFTADPVIRSVLADLRSGVSLGRIAARFHNGLADLVLQLAKSISQREGCNEVVLSGGVWQNMTLLAKASTRLKDAHFNVYTHQLVPANDGAIALGQVAIAQHIFNT